MIDKAQISKVGGQSFLFGLQDNGCIVAVNLSHVREMEFDFAVQKTVVWLAEDEKLEFTGFVPELFPCNVTEHVPAGVPSMTASDVCAAAGGVSMGVLNSLMSRMGFPRYQEVGGKRLWVESEVMEWVNRISPEDLRD